MKDKGAPFADPLIGVRVRDTYEILERLGAGGFGSVYRAKDVDLGKTVAIKVFSSEHAARPDLIDRFFNEARAVAALREEWSGYSETCNLVDVLGMGRLESGAPYMILEYLRGRNLHEWLNAKRGERTLPTFEETLSIIAQICCGLEAVHQARIVHRDLKPGNVVVTPTLTNPLHLKLLDFGIAKLSASDVKTTGDTVEGSFMGSLEFAAPEQARSMGGVDHRADIYSLGVIAYHLATLRKPYKAPTPYAVFADEKNIKPPRTYVSDLPEAWDELIMSMLAHDPADRPQSTLVVAHRLAKALPGGDGMALVKRVAPLLASPEWIQRTRRLIPVRRPPSQELVTLTEDETTAPPTIPDPLEGKATPILPRRGQRPPMPIASKNETPTTLGSVASESIPIVVVEPPRQRRWLLPLLLGGGAALAVFAALVIVNHFANKSAEPSKTAAVAPIDAEAQGSVTAQVFDAAQPTQFADAAASDAGELARTNSEAIPDSGVTASPEEQKTAVATKTTKAQGPAVPSKSTRGKIRVTADPWATVYVDGRKRGTTPITVRVRPGRRKIKLENKALGKRTSFSVEVLPKKTVKVHRKLQ